MSAPLTPYEIARLWAVAITGNRLLIHWAETNYGRRFAVRIGEDMRRPPNEDGAPFITIFPDGGQTGPQRQANTSELGIVAGIADDAWLNEGGIIEMLGLQRLNELCPLLEKAMREALPKARLQEINTEFEILQFPLCMALLSVTVEESLPIGRRV